MSPGQTRFALVVLLVISIFNFVDRTLISILQQQIKEELHLTDTQLGLLTGLAFAFFYSLFSIPVSRFADRTVRKFLIAGALALWTSITALTGLAGSFAVLMLCRIGVAFGESACNPASLSLLADYYPLSRRGTAIALWSIAIPVGASLGMLGGGWLSQNVGWREAFVIVGLGGLLLVPFALMIKEPKRGQFDPVSESAVVQPELKEALRTLWNLKSFRLFVLGASFQSFFMVATQLWAAPFYTRVFNLSVFDVAVFMVVLFGVGAALGAFLAGLAVDRLSAINRRWYGWLPGILVAVSLPFALLQFFSATPYLALGFGLVSTILMTSYIAPLQTVTQSLVGSAMRGFSAAVVMISTNIIGYGFGPLLAGALSDFFIAQGYGSESLRYSLAICATPALLAAWCFIRLGKYVDDELPK